MHIDSVHSVHAQNNETTQKTPQIINYACVQCEYISPQRDSLNAHVKSVHRNPTMESITETMEKVIEKHIFSIMTQIDHNPVEMRGNWKEKVCQSSQTIFNIATKALETHPS